MKSPYVIFDRDGTLIEHVHHLVDPDLVAFKSDLITALTSLAKANFKFGIVTNQSVIGRRLATLERVEEINSKITAYLNTFGLRMEFIAICPHLPDDGCRCRKPELMLGLEAAKKYQIDLAKSYIVGDQEGDFIFGRNLGCKVIQIRSDSPSAPFRTAFQILFPLQLNGY